MQNHRAWLNKAHNDLKGAKVLLRENINDLAVYHAHQSAEKALKGLLSFFGKEPPRTHDLSYLLDRTMAHASGMKEYREACEFLSDLYVETRYPPDIPDYRKEDAQKAIEYATRVLDAVNRIIATD